MADQLGINSTKQRLIGSEQTRSAMAQRAAATQNLNQSEDTFVVNASEKRYLWTARAFAVVTAISLCCNLLLLLTVANILPLSRVEPYLLTLADKSEQVYKIIPYSRNMKSEITETFVRKYVLLRTTLLPDIEEMQSRWQNGGELQEMSSSVVYQDFLKVTGNKLMRAMKQDHLTSNVKIITVNEVDDNVWQVEYSVDYFYPSSKEPRTARYRANMRVRYVPRLRQYKDRLNNPVGFQVIQYGTKKIKE